MSLNDIFKKLFKANTKTLFSNSVLYGVYNRYRYMVYDSNEKNTRGKILQCCKCLINTISVLHGINNND